MSQISNLLAEAIRDQLATEFGEEVSVLKAGRLQDDPTAGVDGIAITVHLGDPADPAWSDASLAYTERSVYRSDVQAPAFEVGGGSTRWRRGVIEWWRFSTEIGDDQDTAREKAAEIMARIERALAQTDVRGLTDGYGEHAMLLMDVWSRLAEGGGPSNSYIWRGKVGWQALTGRPY